MGVSWQPLQNTRLVMPITIEQREDGRVLYYNFTDPWTVSDVVATSAQVQSYIEGAAHKVHTLADLRRSKNLPQGLLHARRALAILFNHQNAGETAIVGASRLAQSMGEIIAQLIHLDRMTFFGHEGEALTHIRHAIANENGQPGGHS
jgi:hypothetical protein